MKESTKWIISTLIAILIIGLIILGAFIPVIWFIFAGICLLVFSIVGFIGLVCAIRDIFD